MAGLSSISDRLPSLRGFRAEAILMHPLAFFVVAHDVEHEALKGGSGLASLHAQYLHSPPPPPPPRAP